MRPPQLILRGVKTIEYRSRPTRPPMIGQRFYIYAARKWAGVNGHDISPSLVGRRLGGGSNGADDSETSTDGRLTHPPAPSLKGGGANHSLPTGVIVGTAVVSHVTPPNGGTGAMGGAYEWHLTQVRRLPKPRKPKRQPQPVWFRPF